MCTHISVNNLPSESQTPGYCLLQGTCHSFLLQKKQRLEQSFDPLVEPSEDYNMFWSEMHTNLKKIQASMRSYAFQRKKNLKIFMYQRCTILCFTLIVRCNILRQSKLKANFHVNSTKEQKNAWNQWAQIFFPQVSEITLIKPAKNSNKHPITIKDKTMQNPSKLMGLSSKVLKKKPHVWVLNSFYAMGNPHSSYADSLKGAASQKRITFVLQFEGWNNLATK